MNWTLLGETAETGDGEPPVEGVRGEVVALPSSLSSGPLVIVPPRRGNHVS